ncbi:PVC-type heme-binding CxxCH protein [Algoriphagus halophilus]|uniref:PVC-type heme-binding CxxCH protein n=1 Tax=Algoriphagus halophilus TaxID=226505 RepID=UPI00358DEF4A
MSFKSITFIFALSVLSYSCESDAIEEPALFSPEEFEISVWAESPMFFNPTNMDVDAKGRIWVTEAVNYRNYNNDSNSFLHHAQGDRVMILEDTDQDGVADSSRVFVQDPDLVSPLGIAVFGKRVFISCAPHLLVYTDEDGDDVPDKKEIFLTGFGGLDHDHSLHSILAGPDGKLYFNTGNAGPHQVTDKSGWTLRSGSLYTGGSPYNTTNSGGQISDDGKVYVGGLALKINPDGTGLEVLAHNFRNSYEVFVDSRGTYGKMTTMIRSSPVEFLGFQRKAMQVISVRMAPELGKQTSDLVKTSLVHIGIRMIRE